MPSLSYRMATTTEYTKSATEAPAALSAQPRCTIERFPTAYEAVVGWLVHDLLGPGLLPQYSAGLYNQGAGGSPSRRHGYLSPEGKRVGLFCYNKGLSQYLQERVSSWRQARPVFTGEFHNRARLLVSLMAPKPSSHLPGTTSRLEAAPG